MNADGRDYLFRRYQQMTKAIAFPLTSEPLRPVFDATGTPVSLVNEHAHSAAMALNLCWQLAHTTDPAALQKQAAEIVAAVTQ
jgi:hypothetical protein